MTCFVPRELYGVIGWPLGQSLSPLLHNSGFQALDFPAAYLAWPLEPARLSQFMENLLLFHVRGLSVTIPHKQTIMPMLHKASEAAQLAGAVNTVYWQDTILCGENTDVAGFLAPLADLPLKEMIVLLLGAGGAAHAVCAGLKISHCRQVFITSPGNKRQYALAERFGFEAIPWRDRYAPEAQLIINATPAGMHGHGEVETPYDFACGPQIGGAWAYDLVYNPLETRFLREARAAGRRCISGLAMFLGQGAAQFRLWTCLDLPETAMKAVENALNAEKR